MHLLLKTIQIALLVGQAWSVTEERVIICAQKGNQPISCTAILESGTCGEFIGTPTCTPHSFTIDAPGYDAQFKIKWKAGCLTDFQIELTAVSASSISRGQTRPSSQASTGRSYCVRLKPKTSRNASTNELQTIHYTLSSRPFKTALESVPSGTSQTWMIDIGSRTTGQVFSGLHAAFTNANNAESYHEYTNGGDSRDYLPWKIKSFAQLNCDALNVTVIQQSPFTEDCARFLVNFDGKSTGTRFTEVDWSTSPYHQYTIRPNIRGDDNRCKLPCESFVIECDYTQSRLKPELKGCPVRRNLISGSDSQNHPENIAVSSIAEDRTPKGAFRHDNDRSLPGSRSDNSTVLAITIIISPVTIFIMVYISISRIQKWRKGRKTSQPISEYEPLARDSEDAATIQKAIEASNLWGMEKLIQEVQEMEKRQTVSKLRSVISHPRSNHNQRAIA